MKSLISLKALSLVALVLSLPMAALSETTSKAKAKTKSQAEQAGRADEAETPLTAAQLALVPNVHTGRQACEAGVAVTLTPDAKSAGYFHVNLKNRTYHMHPVVTTSGALRLEDKKEGAVWLQMSNKSMMMNHKLGARLADDCINDAQAAVALAMKKNATPGLLDAPK